MVWRAYAAVFSMVLATAMLQMIQKEAGQEAVIGDCTVLGISAERKYRCKHKRPS